MKIHHTTVTGIVFLFAGCMVLRGALVPRTSVSFDDGWESFSVRLNQVDTAFAGRRIFFR